MTELKEDAAHWSPSHPRPVEATGAAPDIPADNRPAYQDLDEEGFALYLIDRLRTRLSSELDPDIQMAIGKLINRLVMMDPKVVHRHRALFTVAFDIFTAEKPNMVLAQSIWRDLTIVTDRSSFGLARLASFIAGSTSLSASIAALTLAAILSVVALFVMVGLHPALLGTQFRASELLRQLQGEDAALLVLLVHAAFIGGIVSILARMQDFVDDDTAGPVLVFISVFRKPFLGVGFGVLVFCVLKAGLVTIPGVTLSGQTGIFSAWTLGFLCGFSERFATDMVSSASNRFGYPDPKTAAPGPAAQPAPQQPSQDS